MLNPTNRANIESMLNQINQYRMQASEGVNTPVATEQTESAKATGFVDLIKDSLHEVNAAQNASKALRHAYERGAEIPLTDVVMGMQKSSLAFEATLQIRNKVLKAYEEIMNMPV